MRRLATAQCLLIAMLACVALGSGAEEIERGKFLVANEGLSDPNFDSTVVLIIGHNNMGTLGLIINRPFDDVSYLPVPDKYAGLLSDASRHFGGPVQVSGLRALVESEFTLPNSIYVMDSLYFLDNPSAFDYLLDEPTAMREARLYRGISSWIPGQLAAEISAGAWYLTDGDSELVFSDSTDLWEQLITKIHAKWVNITQSND